jgi:ACS family hexuronate transporter-like MFS transporter
MRGQPDGRTLGPPATPMGVGAGGGCPAGIKAATEWFHEREHAFAVSLFSAGANISAIVTP